MSLKTNIHELTNEHMTHAEDGSYTKAPPLLAQLRAASGSNFGSTGNGSGGQGLIVNTKAVEIETKLKQEALTEHYEMTGEHYRGSLAQLLNAWAIAASKDWQEYLERLTLDWIDQIRTVLVAKRPPWRPSIPCPSCGQRFHGEEREPCLSVTYWDEDTEQMAHPSKWQATCEGCGAEWAGEELKWLKASNDALKTATSQ